jgi:hypothetical protein
MSTLSLRRTHDYSLIYRGIAGGLIAGVIVDAFLFAIGTLSWPQSYLFIASALVGKVALTSTAYVPLGIALHFAISAGWGALFGFIAQARPGLMRRPALSGFLFGLVVLIGMQTLLFAAHVWQAPTGVGQVIAEVIAHTLFFGVPLALWVAFASHRNATLVASA